MGRTGGRARDGRVLRGRVNKWYPQPQIGRAVVKAEFGDAWGGNRGWCLTSTDELASRKGGGEGVRVDGGD
jgi:hypothetical protein